MTSPSLHVLFVDDEQAILDGLRNSLRKERKRWDMSFALGGQQALEAMKQTPADVVITDMRMPGMDGAELLRQIQRDFPRRRASCCPARPSANPSCARCP